MNGRTDLHDLRSYAHAFDDWLATHPSSLQAARQHLPEFGERVRRMQALLTDLFDAGWSRYGWPEAAGGLGGTIMHRAAMWEALARHGLPGMEVFEHLEILGPALVALGPPEFVARAMPAYLSGREIWSQGFSEPEAGSDLAALRTRANPVDGGFRITGRKIWTSWSSYATWCLVLARTGTTESRHRGITAFIVDLTSAGVEVRPIVQANGTDELAEVTFDEVFVPAERIVGALNGGWAVAMHILSSERGTFGWFRHSFLSHQLLAGAFGDDAHDIGLGNAVLDLAAVTAVTLDGLRSHEADVPLGARATFGKLLLCAAEQSVADWLLSVNPSIVAGAQFPANAVQRQRYVFSRIVTVYGGSQQMQLETIAKQLLGLP